tara:strand:- start:123 stop:701 length:579 start_codon:yes stop_codon:yes gene_type:complete
MNVDLVKTRFGKFFEGPKLISDNIFYDERGFFVESWNQKKFDALLDSSILFKQDNHSHSTKGVLRGLHYQISPFAQAKLVRCISGKIYDVFVDLRQSSSTFKCWGGVILSSENLHQLWIPEGFAHGFLVLSDYADVMYKTNQYWSKSSERYLRWDDPEVSISWPLKKEQLILSSKDKDAKYLSELNDNDIFT